MRHILLVSLFASSICFAQKEESAIAISKDGEVSFSGRAGKLLTDNLPKIEPDEACKQNRRCASARRFGNKDIECEISGPGGALSTYTCKVKAISEALAEKLFRQMDSKNQTIVGDKATRRAGHLLCEKNLDDFSCFIRPLTKETVNSCFVITRKSREAAPPAKICIYNSEDEFESAIETTRGEIGEGKYTLFKQTCEGNDSSLTVECPKTKPAPRGTHAPLPPVDALQ